MALEITTTDSQDYKFNPLNFGSLHFTVKASNDAHIALTATQENKPPKYEIFLGGWGNSKSSIRKNNEEPDKVIVDTPKILNGGEAKGFWIKWGGGFIGVGKQGEEKPFMSWQDEESLNVSYFGVRTGWGATGVWTIEAPPAATPGWNIDGPTSGPVQWVHASNGQIPPNALPGGFDVNNEQLYVARAEHNGALIPGKLVPSHGVVYVAWGGVENPKENYEVLCNCNGTWVKANNGEIPLGAISSGHTEDGEPLFIGRGSHDGSVTVGKAKQNNIGSQINKNKVENYLHFRSEEHSYIDTLVMKLLKSSMEKENDDHDVFGAYVAMEMRNLKTPDLQRKLRGEIRDAISRVAREESIVSLTEHTSYPSMSKPDDNLKEKDELSKLNIDSSTANIVKEGSTVKIVKDGSAANIVKDDSTANIVKDDSTANIIKDGSAANIVQDDSTANIVKEDDFVSHENRTRKPSWELIN